MKKENGKISMGGFFIGFAIVLILFIGIYIVMLVNDLRAQKEQYAVEEKNADQNEEIVIEEENTDRNEEMVLDEKIELSEEELEFFTEYLNEKNNNRFLTSYYDEIEKIDLCEVVLDGNDFSTESETQIAKEYEEIVGEEPITDVNKYTSKDLKEFLKEKTGVEFDLEKTNLASKAKYSKKYDAYYIQAGDANYNPIVCKSGYRKGTQYVISGEYTDSFKTNEKFTVTLEKEDNDYLFVSNVESEEEENEITGKWSPKSATQDGKEISLKDIWGTSISYGGYLVLNQNKTYTRFIGTYSSENEDSLQGTYTISGKNIVFTTNNGKKEEATIENNQIIYDFGEELKVTFSKAE